MKILADKQERLAKWRAQLEKALERFPERKKSFTTSSGIELKTVYTDLDLPPAVDDFPLPGEFPYTRGVQRNMYRGRLWTMRQYAGFATAEESNERYKYLLSQGQTGLSVAFDLPTQIGLDSDHPLADGEVGKVGVAIDSLADMEVLFKDIPLDKVSTSMTINAPAMVLLAMYLVVAEKQGVDWASLKGTIQNDILKEYVARGTYIFPPEPSLKIITDIFAFCAENVPNWNTISISGYHIREAGATAVQEIAYTLANAICYVESAIKAGLNVDDFAPRLSFFFNAHSNFFEEIAKFRAARKLWAEIMRHRFGAQNPKSMLLRFHTQTGGSTLTAQQPDNNIVRVALQALSAVLGGTQSLHTNSRDEALALPSEESVRIALRTQQIIAHETGVADVVDPLGGSYYVESLTAEIEKRVKEELAKIDAMGGAVAAINSGYIQRQIQDSAYQFQMAVETKEQIIVGVNQFTVEEETQPDLLRVDPSVQAAQIRRLQELKSRRDSAKVRQALDAVAAAAREGANLFPPVLDAVRSYATLGEICGVLREVYGEYQAKDLI
ncbi:MAG TPA: methylmalonyl-CoA mutase family protein [Bacillota bacterium]|nr:methylmalonyl-CoA mutase family protein [Bacillota bacterium]HPZ90062.1 methylmalonyl-CoA mutase family protein [Bacillota bacterium]HQE01008.1 methylmalonyl-CoA mutase family protein [Bacillota bacterium]